ncbi:MAG: CRISPR-associated DxTHG motif protein [Gammaproteobacteria bacterium]|nr:CRISPR-associated DxTHG motif protein [Gammaproteobacteria bacterium]
MVFLSSSNITHGFRFLTQ